MKVLSTVSAFVIGSIATAALLCLPNPSRAESSPPVASPVAKLHESAEIWALAFNPSNQELATASPHGDEVHVWQWSGGSPRMSKTLSIYSGAKNRGGNPNGLVYSPNGQLLAVGHPVAEGDKLLRVWDGRTGAAHDISDPVGGSRFFGISFSPDSRLLLRSQETGRQAGENFVVENTESWERSWGLRTSPFEPATFALSRDGRFVALGGSVLVVADAAKRYLQPQIKIISSEKRALERSFDVLSPGCELRAVAWGPDGTRIVVGGRPVFAGNRLTHATIQILDTSKGMIGEYQSENAFHLQGLIYSANGKYLVIGWDTAVEIWNSEHTKLLQVLPAATSAVALSADSRYLAVATQDSSVTIWAMK